MNPMDKLPAKSFRTFGASFFATPAARGGPA
jgi:hypothetical protein